VLRLRRAVVDLGRSFSFIGLVFAGLFFAASVTPSLLPRQFLFQGLLSGFAIAVGYGIGECLAMFFQFLEIPPPPKRLQTRLKVFIALSVAGLFIYFLRQMTFWQNSLRALMEMEPLESVYPTSTAAIAIAFGVFLIICARGVMLFRRLVADRLRPFLPRRIAYGLSATIVAVTLFFIGNGVIARGLLNAADAFFLRADELVDEEVAQPLGPLECGSADSLVDWDSIGRRGKEFLVGGPTQQSIQEFWGNGRDAAQPIRVYVGVRSAESKQEQADLAVEELKRVGAFERSLLVVATPTGTGWLDPGAVDTIEYLHAGDTAIVSTQYSYLPSWITILVDPERSIDSARYLFEAVHEYWKTLPEDTRPRLYLHGLSLGSLGSEVSAPWYAILEDPPQGAVWSGPPFPSTHWEYLSATRNPESPAWLPKFRDGSVVRFTAQENTLDTDQRWGPLRTVYIQYASDPMVFFSPDLLFKKPAWLSGPRGPDVSPHLKWYPVVTFLKIAFDLPMAISVPTGYGHNYAPKNYIDAWTAVTQPEGWTAEHTRRLVEQMTP
jgi:uncharacterized membrane protein